MKAALATLKTSRLTTKGFTLIEIIIVVGLIAAIAAFALPKLGGKTNETKTVLRKLTVLSRELKYRAKLQNATYRLVINMAGGEKPKHEIWVEAAPGSVLNNYDPKNPPKLPEPGEEEDEKEKAPSATAFAPDTKVMKTPLELPDGLTFSSVELASLEAPVTAGIVYIHYFPTGFSEEAVIHLKQGEDIDWSLALDPLTGRLDILKGVKTLAELQAR